MPRVHFVKKARKENPIILQFLLPILLLLATVAYADTDYGRWRWSRDAILKNVDASYGHFVGSYALDATLIEFGLSPRKSATATLLVGVIWEVKDGFIPYERAGMWGGEGFSWRDIVCDVAGVALHRLVVWGWSNWRKAERRALR